jgi:capsid protein
MHTTLDRRRVILGPDGEPLRTQIPEPLAAVGSFQGADFASRDRGYVYVPTLDTLKEVDAWSRTELLKRSRFIYNSGGGLIHRGVDGVARMVCGTGLFPYPLGKNKDRNQRLRRLWNARAENANTFDLSRKFTCGMAQQAIVRGKVRDGDVAPVLARDEDGRLRVMFYESHQVGQGSTRVDPSFRWHDGVQLDRHNAPVAYRILSRDMGTNRESSVDVPAQNVLFCVNYERFGQVRGLTRFYPVINKVLDRGEIMHAITKGIKMREQIAYAIEQQLGSQQVVQTGGRGTGYTALAPNPTTQVEVAPGKYITMAQFFGAGKEQELKPGQSFRVIESSHPDANVVTHLENLVRDVAWALKFSPELLWNITQLGGANTRFIMADAQSQIEVEQQELVEQFLGPYFLAWQRDMIEAGEIEDAPDWELHTWLLPKRLTVDFGRDGKLHIEQAKRGMITLKSLYGYVGDEWQIEVDQYLDERQYIKDGLTANGRNLTWAEAFPEIGSGTTAAQEQAKEAESRPDSEAVEARLEALERAITNKPFRL